MGLQHVLSLEPGSILWTIITFLAVAFVIGRYGWKPILSGLKSREDSIRRDLETAKSEREKAAVLLVEHQTMMAGAKKDANDIVQKAQESANRLVEEARSDAKEEAQKIIDRARGEIERESDSARTELRKYVADLTARATSRLIGKTVNAQDHEKLIFDALKEDR
jgi:F-type H+-transporting ATPase subunit b